MDELATMLCSSLISPTARRAEGAGVLVGAGLSASSPLVEDVSSVPSESLQHPAMVIWRPADDKHLSGEANEKCCTSAVLHESHRSI